MKKLILLLTALMLAGCGETPVNPVEIKEIFSVEIMMKDSTLGEYRCSEIAYHKEINTLILFTSADTMLIPSFAGNVLRFKVVKE